MAAILLENLTKIYGRKPGVRAVRDLQLQIRDQELLVLLGPSGCGKTSTMRMIAGLEPVTAGAVYFDGRPVQAQPPGQRNVAMAFESYALYPTLTVRENIAFPLHARRLAAAAIEEKVQWAARTLHITDILARLPRELSGGQQQRVSLARAIVRNPAVFLLDEPLSHLDQKQRQFMRVEIKRLNADLKTTMVLVTHDQKEAMALADRIAVMHDGHIQQVGTPQEVYDDPANAFVAGFVGEPHMNFLDVQARPTAEAWALWSAAGQQLAAIPVACLPAQSAGWPTDLRLGIRPRHVRCAEAPPSTSAVPSEVFVYESVGEKGILTVECGGQLVSILTDPERRFERHQPVWLQFPLAHLYLFSRATGERLRLALPAPATG